MLFTQMIHKIQTQKNKENIFNLTAQYLEKDNPTDSIQGLTSSEQARRVTDWSRGRRLEMV